MAGKMMSNKAWATASKYSKEKFGVDLTQMIADRDTSSGESKSAMQKNINEAIRAGNEAERSSRVDKMSADVMSDYNAKVDENARNRMGVANRTMDKIDEATVDVLSGGQKAMAELDMSKKKKEKVLIAGE